MQRAKHKTGLVFFPAFDWAISPTHPEREERLLYTQDQVFEAIARELQQRNGAHTEIISQENLGH